MKKVLDSFINQNHDAFTDSFEEHKRKNLINREDYIELQEESKKIYENPFPIYFLLYQLIVL